MPKHCTALVQPHLEHCALGTTGSKKYKNLSEQEKQTASIYLGYLLIGKLREALPHCACGVLITKELQIFIHLLVKIILISIEI